MAYVIMGIGNPGAEYAKTRHNAGRMVAELLAREEGLEFAVKKSAEAIVAAGDIDGEKTVIALPETYMNHSGRTAAALVKSKAAAKKLLVIRDELDMPLGAIKMTGPGRGSGGHKGAESIMRALKSKDFIQMKIGISPATAKGKVKKPEAGEKVVKHVIGKFSPKEEALLKKTLARAAIAARAFVTDGPAQAMLIANTAP
ncbi:MAG TPA: aminoacyl-tRNA hydrolase [Candidatus Paceibacterota bacterium]|nr:aminoacyl-tRNA hydrolase [Candidatus Paceibacterota bacterium]